MPGVSAPPAASDPDESDKIDDARRRLRAARADIHPGMNSKQRRAVAKKHGIFKYPGLYRHLTYDRTKLDKKTQRNAG